VTKTLTPGEVLMARYLDDRGWPWDYEAEVGNKHPDFTVRHPDGPFVIEVYEPVLELPPGGGSFDSYRPLRGMFTGNKRQQYVAARDEDMPFLIALARTHSHVDFEPVIVAGAMFGDLQVSVTFGPDAEDSTPISSETIFGPSGKVQPGRFTGLSAVLLLHDYNPTQVRADQAVRDRLGSVHVRPDQSYESVLRDITDGARVSREVYEHFAATGDYIEGVRRTRLTVLHNRYTDRPLGVHVLNGPHDVQWGMVDDRAYGPVAGLMLPRTW
jgi:hypothetical protein